MRIFEFPYVIITILGMCFLIMGLIGVYFTIKSLKTAKCAEQKDFCSLDKIKGIFDKCTNMRKRRCLIYASVSLDSAERLYSESKAMRMMDKIKKIMFTCFCVDSDGEMCINGKNSFVSLNYFDAEYAKSLIDKCYESVSKVFSEYDCANIAHINFGFFCTVSTDVNFRTALERAKQACTMAVDKEILYREWDSNNGKEFEKKIKIENSIKNEIDNNKFFLEYQPIIDAETEKIIGAEVLSRLNSESDGILSPHSFLSAVNNMGLNREFDYFIFEKNCKWISNDKEKRANHIYTINFSRYTLCDEEFADNIIKIIDKYELDYSCIAVEILEDKSLKKDEIDILTKNLMVLKEKGVLLLLDDFGKGYTSFGDLAEFNINIVKIDKSITQNTITEKGFLILTNIIKIAHELGFKTLCEGVETDEQRKKSKEAGCDMLQGYFFYRPMPVTRLETLLDD